MKRTGVFAGLVVSVALAFSAHAQNSPFVIDNQPNYFSLALGVAPDYVGSDDFKFVAGPAGRLGFGKKRYVELVATQLSSNLINHEYWLSLPFNRSE